MKVSEINIYPIKSLSGIKLDSSIVEDKGLKYDRRWLLVNEKNEFLTQRNFPKMATVRVEIIENGIRVFDKRKSIDIPFLPSASNHLNVKIWSSRVRGFVYEREINDWFSDVLQSTCKLVLMPVEARRKVNYFYKVHDEDVVSFADAYPFLLIGEGSLEDLNTKLNKKIPMNRFRPNFVVSDSEPFAEDNWKKIKIGETVFYPVKPCGRCVITTINQETGISDGGEPLKTLATYRIPKRSIKRKIMFGQNLIAENVGGEIKIGDAVEVLERKN
ncbi:MAG: MOSC domain-containing protein [Acidobacteriota bacterium]|nr:MOSC domain-containing protein [Acidobacteriota bacterium]